MVEGLGSGRGFESAGFQLTVGLCVLESGGGGGGWSLDSFCLEDKVACELPMFFQEEPVIHSHCFRSIGR